MKLFGWELRRAPDPSLRVTRIAIGIPDSTGHALDPSGRWIKLLDLDVAWFRAAIERKGVWELHSDGALFDAAGKRMLFRLKPHVANVWIYGEIDK